MFGANSTCLVQTIRVWCKQYLFGANNTCWCKQYVLVQTILVGAYNTCWCKQYIFGNELLFGKLNFCEKPQNKLI